ncbi:MAG: hypothetical protein ACOH15_06705 [Acetobacterium sp.]
MGFFDIKAICVNCEKEVGLNRYTTAEGDLCSECHKLCGYNMNTPINIKTMIDIHRDIAENNKEKEALSQFTPSKKISKVIGLGNFIELDEEKRQWIIPNGFLCGKKPPKVYRYDDIIEYELLEDGDTIIKGGIGSAIAGGILFGSQQSLVGGIAAGNKSKKSINSLKIKIAVKHAQKPAEYIKLIKYKTKVTSSTYLTSYGLAHEVLDILAHIQEENDQQSFE